MFEKIKGKFASAKAKMMAAATAVMALALPVSAQASTPPSTAIDFSGTAGLDVGVTDVVSTGFSFMNMFGQYTTLVLGVLFAPVAIGFVIWIWKKLPKMGGGKA